MKEKTIALVLIALCALAALVAMIKPGTKTLAKESNDLKIDTQLIKKTIGGKKIKVIPLEGIIYDSFSSRSAFRADYNAAFMRKHLYKALEDDATKAVILRVNSPGGTVATSQELYSLVLKLREQGKPVVVSMSDLCASGCYYIASAADKIVANKGSLTGSIGVISQGLNYKGLMDKLGLRDQTIKAGKFKDMGSGARALGAEEKAILQALIDNSYKQFLEDISFSRSIEMSKLEKIAQGLVYTGEQALEVNLVDELGTYEDAKLATRALLKKMGHKDPETYELEELWKKSKLKSIEDIFDMNPFASLGSIFDKSYDLFAAEEIMWLHR